MQFQAILLGTLVLILSSVQSQFVSPPKYSHLLSSPINRNISIAFTEPLDGTCLTTFSTQKQYSGYISLPPYTIAPIQQNYSIHTFFWFVEARERSDSAPLTIFINGGPGSSSLIGFFQEIGPCEVVQLEDGYGTQPRLWGWDRSSNMVFIDQPVQTGLSYDTATNMTRDFFHDTYGGVTASLPAGLPPFLFERGTFSSQNSYSTANTTKIAAHAIFHFLQAFLSAFPQYNPGIEPNSTTVDVTGINLFTESYGGIMGPVFARFLDRQNELRRSGLLPEKTLEIELTSLGVINGLIDQKVQMPFYPRFANNNTYGISALDLTTTYNALSTITAANGCIALIDRCRTMMNTDDPNGYGNIQAVNDACAAAQMACNLIENLYLPSGLSVYDIRQKNPSPFPSQAYVEYLNTRQVQQSIGSMVNYTDSSNAVFQAFIKTGDVIRDDPLSDLAYMLNKNVRISLIYGDADYICNWKGGEAVSTALANSLDTYATSFSSAGYAEVVVNNSYIGGSVKQFGNLSFVRVYDAGHQVPAYQPETVFTVFTRVILGTNIATGQPIDLATFNTSGPQESLKMNTYGASASPICWVRSPNMTCTSNQLSAMLSGQGVVINGIWYQKPSDFRQPSSSVNAGQPGSTPTVIQGNSTTIASATIPLTGVYTATSTSIQKAAAEHHNVPWVFLLITSYIAVVAQIPMATRRLVFQ